MLGEELATLIALLALVSGVVAVLTSIIAIRALRRVNALQEASLKDAAQQALALANAAEAAPPFPIVYTGLLLRGEVREEDTLAMLMQMSARGQLRWETEQRPLGERHYLFVYGSRYHHPLERALAGAIERLSTTDGCDLYKLLPTLHNRYDEEHRWLSLVFDTARAEGIVVPIHERLKQLFPRRELLAIALAGLLGLAHFALVFIASLEFIGTYIRGNTSTPQFLAVLLASALLTLPVGLLWMGNLHYRRRILPLTHKGLTWRAYLLEYRNRLVNRVLGVKTSGDREVVAWSVALNAPLPEEVAKRVRRIINRVKFVRWLKEEPADVG